MKESLKHTSLCVVNTMSLCAEVVLNCFETMLVARLRRNKLEVLVVVRVPDNQNKQICEREVFQVTRTSN